MLICRKTALERPLKEMLDATDKVRLTTAVTSASGARSQPYLSLSNAPMPLITTFGDVRSTRTVGGRGGGGRAGLGANK
ncbi:hypothetical protein EVAR_103082_1 [Eumeta japonica]|uniref:Uncharacterized protein n=1 Tax=Eumeta variegata TaxID=151549 RepID=A0A4C1WRB6_EUMVA|nr:hypothetical protein EVAR_103082_1 [Eumeta japonica]